jgi:hypothetical protein
MRIRTKINLIFVVCDLNIIHTYIKGNGKGHAITGHKVPRNGVKV